MNQTEEASQAVAHTPTTPSSLPARRLSRRTLLTHVAALGAAVGGAGLLAACGGSASAADGKSSDVASGHAAVCADAELSEQDRARRAAVHYVDVSPQRGKACGECRFFKPADDDGCGKCDILAGQVAAAGYCNAFVQG